jgi:dienelactone hydrolase
MRKFVVALHLLLGMAVAQADPIPENRLSYSVYKANPFSGRPAPTVMLAHGCNGIVPIQTNDWVQDLTRWGYNAVVVDSLGPRDLTTICKTKVQLKAGERMPEFYAIADIIKKQNWHNGRLGFIGFSHGGSVGLELSAKGQVFDAIVSYYPNCRYGQLKNRNLKIKTQIHLSLGDTWAPPSFCNDLVGVTENVIHQNATHAWEVRAPNRVRFGEFMSYDPNAAEVSFNATRRFFEETLK